MLSAMPASRIALLVVAACILILMVASQLGYLSRTAGVIVAVVAIVVFLVLSWRRSRKS